MLLKKVNKEILLSESLILLNQEDLREKIFIFKRTINPIDFESIKDKLSNKSVEQIKEHLYNSEIAYISVLDNNTIEIYRDIFGLSDIYYKINNSEYLFSDILADFYHFGINNIAVEQYKRIGYIPAPNTIINNVKKLFPGEKIIINIESDTMNSIRKSLSEVFNNSTSYSQENFKEKFDNIFKKNISEADGLLLSGGNDSSLIAYFLNRVKNKVPAFTVVTKDANSNIEKERAIKTANLFCRSHKILELSSDLFEQHFRGVFEYMDEPFSDNAILGTSIIAKNAFEMGVKFLAEGEGGDELFGHAEKIKKYILVRRFLPNRCIRKLSYPLSIISDKLKILTMSKEQLINRFVAKDLTNKEFANLVLANFKDSSFNDNDIIGLAILLSLNIGTEIPKNKIASAYSGCNFSAPFLNIDLLKLALTIPPKIKYKRERAVIKNIYEKEMKREEYDNKKIGMTVPTSDWILEKHTDILLSNKFYKKKEINELIDKYESNPTTSLDQKIWRVFVLNLWFDINKNFFIN